ncbi:hypothetical protein EYF80_019188 [Liparis tanakae]|uniref:Uncharacterized protein n=1 Tax=Liparis tanakae TaxID=230148 RepID=A0A4Z2I001_9TELE|nr:hypothetical protein EYF80_019188 [Liparis tanakae]
MAMTHRELASSWRASSIFKLMGVHESGTSQTEVKEPPEEEEGVDGFPLLPCVCDGFQTGAERSEGNTSLSIVLIPVLT